MLYEGDYDNSSLALELLTQFQDSLNEGYTQVDMHLLLCLSESDCEQVIHSMVALDSVLFCHAMFLSVSNYKVSLTDAIRIMTSQTIYPSSQLFSVFDSIESRSKDSS